MASSILLAVLWGFPAVWYTKVDATADRFWFSAKDEVPGYEFVDQPIGEAMEQRLVADETFNGQFLDDSNHAVLAFMAKRHEESINEIGLFVHTPDRCWTEGGWKIKPIEPDYVEVDILGHKVGFERRLFVYGAREELVYFTGMVGGQTLPYRLDHNLSVAMKYQLKRLDALETGASERMVDTQLWGRVWDSFVSRRPLLGPKQFIRVSTTLSQSDPSSGDARIQGFLQEWLEQVDYQKEMEAWKQSEKQSADASA